MSLHGPFIQGIPSWSLGQALNGMSALDVPQQARHRFSLCSGFLLLLRWQLGDDMVERPC